jgi:hypothetical protein
MTDTTDPDPYITVAAAAARHGKRIETIRRWANLPYPPVRTHVRMGTRYVHQGDIARSAAAHPPPLTDQDARDACDRAGHIPDTTGFEDYTDGAWVTVAEASRSTCRSKSSIRLWMGRGEIAAVSCACRWRRFVWEPDLIAADLDHKNHAKTKGRSRES